MRSQSKGIGSANLQHNSYHYDPVSVCLA